MSVESCRPGTAMNGNGMVGQKGGKEIDSPVREGIVPSNGWTGGKNIAKKTWFFRVFGTVFAPFCHNSMCRNGLHVCTLPIPPVPAVH